jgi:hypothetical protein
MAESGHAARSNKTTSFSSVVLRLSQVSRQKRPGRHNANTRKFMGSVAFILQPVEQMPRWLMYHGGIMDRFSISKAFGIHNVPGLEIGKSGMRNVSRA